MTGTIRVIERNTKHTVGWVPSPGLTNIPASMRAEVEATVAAQNAQLGWAKYMVLVELPKLPPSRGSWGRGWGHQVA